MVYYCQAANLPGIAFGMATQPTILGHPVKVPTGSYRFEDLQIVFRVDENIENWLEIYDWMRFAGNYENANNTDRHNEKTTGARLLVTNSSYKPKFAIDFKNIFPIYLSSLNFNVTKPKSEEILCIAKFAFTGYTVIGITGA